MCVITAQPLRLTSVAVLNSDLQANFFFFIKTQILYYYIPQHFNFFLPGMVSLVAQADFEVLVHLPQSPE